MKQVFICDFCKRSFNLKSSYSNHIKWCRGRQEVYICENCGKEHDGSFGSGRFCSSSCSHTRVHTDRSKSLISKSLIVLHGLDHSPKFCQLCGKELSHYHLSRNTTGYCHKCWCIRKHDGEFPTLESTRLKLQNAGKHSAEAQSEIRRSKNEIEFCRLCEEYFCNVEHNKPIFNGWDADVIIHDIKFAVLWNGVWHYKKCTANHSVDKVQSRDSIKIMEIIKYGYTPYIIKDLGKHNKVFVKTEFDKFINFISNKI